MNSLGAEGRGSGLTTSVVSTRRVMLLLAGLVLLLGLVTVRTFYLQSVKNRMLTQYAQGQQQYTQPLPAVRGDIVDRRGRELAVGEDAVTFFADPRLLRKNRAKTALRIAGLLDMDPAEEEDLVDRMVSAEGGFVYVKRQVPRSEARKLQKADIKGVGWYDEQRRMYPAGPVAGQLIGRVDIDNRGIEGIEALYDRSLTGRAGSQVAVVDPSGVPIDVLKLRREQDGKDVQLTIDVTLQQEAERILALTQKKFAAKAATAIVMDPRTGDILAMAGTPRVDPAKWGSASELARRNRAITDQYEPGSTFKIVTVSAALEEGVTKPEREYLLKPQLTFCNEKETCTVKDAEERGTEWLSTEEILVQSSNIGTITLAQSLAAKYDRRGECGRCAIDRWIRRFGFGSETGIDFPGEIAGTVIPADDWTDVSIGNIPIGQGIAVTPIQLISAYAAIANDGIRVQPHLLRRIGDEPEAAHRSRRVLSARTAATMRRMFKGVVKDDRGTGRKAGIPGYLVGGKTGTANVAEGGVYVKGKYISSFVGFVPANNPRLVTLVVVDEPNVPWGGDVAAPAFEKITEFALGYLAIPPDGIV